MANAAQRLASTCSGPVQTSLCVRSLLGVLTTACLAGGGGLTSNARRNKERNRTVLPFAWPFACQMMEYTFSKGNVTAELEGPGLIIGQFLEGVLFVFFSSLVSFTALATGNCATEPVQPATAYAHHNSLRLVS